MTDAVPDPEVLEERLREARERDLAVPEGVDEADALDQYRELTAEREVLPPRIADDVNEADAIEQAMTVGYDDDEEWRG